MMRDKLLTTLVAMEEIITSTNPKRDRLKIHVKRTWHKKKTKGRLWIPEENSKSILLRQTVIIPRMVQNDELIKGAHKQTCIFHIHHNDIASWMSAA